MKKQSLGEGITEENFRCGICLELIVDPTTLTCGHTMCRYCVASWWHNSSKTTCPECQQVWHGFPQINFTLRNTIHSLFPEESVEREKARATNPECKKMIELFNASAKGNTNTTVNNSNRNWTLMFVLIAVSIGVAVVISVGVKKFMGGSQMDIMSKPLSDWSPEDVGLWVGGIGLWSKPFGPRFVEAGIDGSLLAQMTDIDLQGPPINMTMPVQRRLLLERLHNVTAVLSHHPSGLWEYKERKSGMAIFIMLGIREFPRSTLAYLYIFNYADTFLPIFDGTINLKDRPALPDPAKKIQFRDWLQFFPRWLLLPYYLVARFASHYLDINYWTSRVVIMHSVLMTLAEFTKARQFFSIHIHKLPYFALKQLLYVCLLSFVVQVVWPFVPFFIVDCVFYWFLYISPFDALNRLRKRLTGARQPARAVNE